jgi:hypothetical protein
VVKGVLTDLGFANTVAAQQVLGGHGYIAEWGMEQFVRDARIPMIYEGANGIQALDLVGRKLPKDGGRALQAYFADVQAFLNAHKDDAAMKPYIAPLNAALGHLQQATMWFVANAMAKPDNAGAGGTDFMHLFGLVALGYMWARIVKAANEKLAAGGNGDAERYKAKLVTRVSSWSACCRKPARISRASRRERTRRWRCRPTHSDPQARKSHPIVLVGINALEHDLEMGLDQFVAFARLRLQRIGVDHAEQAAPRLQDLLALEIVDHRAGISAADTEQGGEPVLRQRHAVLARALHRRDDPFRGPLLE